jgi:hypothetical protein
MDTPDTHDGAENKRERCHDVAPSPTRVIIESLPIAGPPPEWKSEKNKDRGLQLVLLGISFLTLLAVTWYAWVATQQRNAMIGGNRISQDALYSVQRAFVAQQKPTTELATYTNLEKTEKPSTVIETTAHWENIGNTPAIDVVTLFASVQQQNELTEEEFLGKNLIDASSFNAATLAPRGTVDGGPIRQYESWFKEQPNTPWFYWGWMTYKDIFPNTKTHVTEFCWRVTEIKYQIAADGKPVGKPHFSAGQCAQHNCIDEFCADYAAIVEFSKGK